MMKHVIFLLLSAIVAGQALELDFSGYKKFIDEESDGFRKTAYQANDEIGEFQVVYVSHVSQKRNEFSYIQSITIGIKGTQSVLADIFVSYDKNGQYFKGVTVEKAEWAVSYGRYSGPEIIKEEECITVSERTAGPKDGRKLVFIRKNGIFSIYDTTKTAESKF